MELCSGLPVPIYLGKRPLNSVKAMEGKGQKPVLIDLEPRLCLFTVRESNFGQGCDFYCGRLLYANLLP